jgi:hypothetical protein
MRRLGTLLLALLATVAAGGCSGEEAQRAEELLLQSDRALASLKSYRFAGRLTVESDGTEFTVVMRGGGNTKNGGASYVTMRGEGIPGFREITVVQQAETLWVGMGGDWTRAQASPGQPTGLDQFDLSPYVKDVSVTEGATADGEPAVKLSGVLDTTGMFRALLGGLGDLSGGSGANFDDVGDSFGDIRVVLYISEASHLPIRTLVDMPIETDAGRIELRMDFALEPARRRVRIPIPTA